jgi:hypothetical protein
MFLFPFYDIIVILVIPLVLHDRSIRQGLGGAEKDLLSALYPQYTHKMPGTGATLSMDNSIPYVFQVRYQQRFSHPFV